MTCHPPPLIGFNNNVRYRGHRFHIQTEDSGVARPRIVTHLFVNGGHIVKTIRTDYSEYVDDPDRAEIVTRMMREQHKAMALDLRDGFLDRKLDGLLELEADSKASPSEVASLKEATEPEAGPGSVPEPERPAPSAPRESAPASRPARESARPDSGRGSSKPRAAARDSPTRYSLRPTAEPEQPLARRSKAPAARSGATPARSKSAPAARKTSKPPAGKATGSAAPPPPSARKPRQSSVPPARPSAAPAVRKPRKSSSAARKSASAPAARKSSPPKPRTSRGQRPSLSRPAASVLRNRPSAQSIFGAPPPESLDDVILGYLESFRENDGKPRK